ncbi:MAG: amino acid adenylation domain-containing protein, partial [Bacillota bacterium]|nr:amino acid adenylation domain-containing protein [Bacillota bacterium]
MGIIKAGGAYLPIDPEYPKERIEYMLEDSKADILLTQTHLVDKSEFSGNIIEIDREDLYVGDSSNLEKINISNDLAYVIYTSGTTGNAKGVMIMHFSVVSYCNCMKEKASITVEDETALLSSYSFDLGYTTVFTSLTSGIALNILPEDKYKDPKKLLEYLEDDITYIKITPSLFNLIINCEDIERIFNNSKLRLIILGGESINIKDIKQFNLINKGNKIKLMNHYGPTESTIGCVTTMIKKERIEEFKNVIGKPLNNIKVYILDKNKKNLAIGVSGELCISGTGLSRGYLNRPELTEEKFIQNPYEPGERMYKTGDLARWLPDGNIEFMGRIDHQVKIRGFRIELGEIENQLLKHEEIKEAVVIDREDIEGNKYLCAYV